MRPPDRDFSGGVRGDDLYSPFSRPQMRERDDRPDHVVSRIPGGSPPGSGPLARAFNRIYVVTFGGLILAAFVGVVILEYHHRRTHHALTTLARATEIARDMRSGIDRQFGLVVNRFDTPAPEFIATVNAIDADLGETSAAFLVLDVPLDERVLIEDIRVQQAAFTVAIHRINEDLHRGRRAAAGVGLVTLEARRERLARVLDELDRLHIEESVRLSTGLSRSLRLVQVASAVAGGLLFLVLVVLIRMFRARAVLPLAALGHAATRIGAGDLQVRVEVERDDELGGVGRAVNAMAAQLEAARSDLEAKVADRTQRLEELQQQLVHSTKMSALGRLVGGVAHEINNPLTAIRGFAELTALELEQAADPPPSLRRMHHILDQTGRCQRIVEDLLQFTRRHGPMQAPVALNGVADRVVRLREYELRTHGITLEQDFAEPSPVVMGDAQKLDQLLLNLVNNAVDAVAESSHSLRLIQITTRTVGGKGVLEVLDNGPGIENPDRVFEPFFTTKGPGQGTGLGLSVCYGIASEHGGTITAENTGGGARFSVRIPLAEMAEVPAEATPLVAPPTPVGEGHLALVVDDELTVREVISGYLSALGVEVVTACDAEQAIASLRENTDISVVVADLRMPGRLDGLCIHAWIMENRPDLARRFLLVSGEEASGPPGPVPRLLKPFSVEEFARALRQLLEDPS
jgi:signal transduction histidine kinase